MLPTAFLFSPTSNYFVLRDALVTGLAATLPAGVGVRVRGGSVPRSTSETVEVTFGSFAEGRGRSLERSTQRARPGLEFSRIGELKGLLDDVWGSPARLLGDVSTLDVLAVSALPRPLAKRLASRLNASSPLVSVVQFRPESAVAQRYLWRLLVLSALIGDGKVVMSLPDSPELAVDANGDLYLTPHAQTYREPYSAGFFYESEFSDFGVDVLIEPQVLPFKVPADLPRPSELDEWATPVGRVMQHLPFTTGTRISSIDDRRAPATVRRDFSDREFPDIWNVTDKVSAYLLDRSHPEEKWRAFAAMGYRSDDAVSLAGLLSSALLGEFRAVDSRATADGAVQFGVSVLLPGARGGKVPVSTAWYFRPDQGLRLSTAFPGSDRDESALPMLLPDRVIGDWDQLISFITDASSALGARHLSSARSFSGWLWVPRRGPAAQEEFFLWLRRHGDTTEFRRSALGGPVLQYFPAGAGIGTETQVAAELRCAQALLATAGILSEVEMHGD